MHYTQRPDGAMALKLALIVVATAAIGGIGYYLIKDEVHAPSLRQPAITAPIAPIVEQPLPAPQEKPVYAEPKPVPSPEPLPDLSQSDAVVMAALKGLGITGLLELIVPDEILRKFVRAVDALEDGKIVTEYRPIVSPSGAMPVDAVNVQVAAGDAGEYQAVEMFRISPKGYARYKIYVAVASQLDSPAVANLYKRFYPLLNTAYQELGLKKGNFHSVMIRALDSVIAAPAVVGDLSLIRPKVYYQFADPVLEALPASHKLLLRMGPENAQAVQQSLRGLRAKIL